MTKREITIQIPSGLEARPIAMLVQVASQFNSEIHLENEGRSVNAKSIMGMMTLGLASGEKVVVTANGADEEAALKGIEDYLSAQS
jgi:catabolite repression HPr-like protein